MASSSGNATSSGIGANDETKSSSSKLDVLLKKLHTTADSSTEGASDSKSKKSTGSSRRKPKVTRKVVESAEDNSDGYEYINTPSRMNGNSSPKGKRSEENGIDLLDSCVMDSDGNEVLADGTMVVQPEAVVEKKSCSKGHESRKDLKPKLDDLGIVLCTACQKQVNPTHKNAVNRHPVLKVLICKACYVFYTSDDFGQDSDGMDNQCRWCGEGGNLIICDYCHNAFCSSCVRRNFGRAALGELEKDTSTKWRCYVCNSKPLKKLTRDCDRVLAVIEEVEKQERLAKEKQRRPESSSNIKDGKARIKSRRESDSRSSSSRNNAVQLKEFEITTSNVKPVLSRLSAATSSFSWLLSSLEDDVKRDASLSDVALKLKRSMTGFRKMFFDIETYARESSRSARKGNENKSRNSAGRDTPQGEKRVRSSVGHKKGSEPTKSHKLSTSKKNEPCDIINYESSDEEFKVEGKPTKPLVSTTKPDDVKNSTEEMMDCTDDALIVIADGDEPSTDTDSLEKSVEKIVETLGSNIEALAKDDTKAEDTPKKTIKKIIEADAEKVVPDNKCTAYERKVKVEKCDSELSVNESKEGMKETSDLEGASVCSDVVDVIEAVEVSAQADDKKSNSLPENSSDIIPADENVTEEKGQSEPNDKEDTLKDSSATDSKGLECISLLGTSKTAAKDLDLPSTEKSIEDFDKNDFMQVYKAALCDGLNRETEEEEDHEALDSAGPEEMSSENPSDPESKKSKNQSVKKKRAPVTKSSKPREHSSKDRSEDDNESKLSDAKTPEKKRRDTKKGKQNKKSSGSDSEYEVVSSKGKGKGKNSKEAIKERKLKLKIRKTKEENDEHHVSITISDEDSEGDVIAKGTAPSTEMRKKGGKLPDDVDDSGEEGEGAKRSHADLNAQISLHRELRSDDSSAENSGQDPSDDESSNSSENDSGSDYKPSSAKSQPKKGPSRSEAAKLKTQSKFNELKKKQEQMKKRKLEKEKERKRREKQRSEEMDDDSSDDEESVAKKKKGKKSSKSAAKDSSNSDSDFKKSPKGKSPVSKKDSKNKKKKTEGKKDTDSDDSSDVKKPRRSKEMKGGIKIKIKKVKEGSESSNYDSNLEDDLAGLESLPKGKVKRERKIKENKSGDLTSKSPKSAKVKGAEDNKSPRQKKKERQAKKTVDIDALSSGDNGSDDGGDEEMEVDKLESGDEESELLKLKAAQDEERIAESRRALLDSESSAEDDSSDLSDAKEKKTKSKKPQKNGTGESEDESDIGNKSKSKRQRQTALLTAKLSDSNSDDFEIKKRKKKDDDDEEFLLTEENGKDEEEDEDKDEDFDEELEDEDSTGNKKDQSEEDISGDSELDKKKKKKPKKKKKNASDDDFESDSKTKKGKGKRKRKRIKAPSSSDSETADSDGLKPEKKKRKKKKKKGEEDSEEDGSDLDNTPGKKRKNIKKIMKDKKLSQDTKDAAKAEEERRKRLKEKQKVYNQIEEEDKDTGMKTLVTTNITLEVDSDGKPLIEIHKEIVNKLKPHQVEAVQFLWDNLVENLDRLKEESGSGCILAHCMGLGKTLSMISFIHTLLINEELTNHRTCIVVCPLNTVLNWVNEFEKWIPEDEPLDVYELTTVKDNWGRTDMLKSWHEGGGVLIMGYEMYRNLSQCKRVRNKKHKKIFNETLVDPGPDLVVCDEGHILKNDKSSTSIAMNAVRTKRRVVLTGTPLQNNLSEYHCMVDFVKHNLLGSRKEFCNRFVNPITNGQCADASRWDVKLMKKRAHILHETLAGCVQRKDYSALTKFLPPKHEYILMIRLSKVQCQLYEKYLEIVGRSGTLQKGDVRGASLFSDFQNLARIWTHPWILKLHEVREQNKRTFDDEDSFVDDESEGDDSFIDDSESDTSDPGWRRKKKNKDKGKDSEDKDEKENVPKAGTSSGKRGSDRESDVEIVKKWNTRSRGKDGDSEEEIKDEETREKLSQEWWADYFTEEDQYRLELSGKLMVLAELLKMCEAIGDKVLVFSQSLLSLDLIEDFLEHWDKQAKPENPEEQVAGMQGWSHGIDYFRMDGSTSSALRKKWSEIFNDRENTRARLFLISTKAGSLGTNMVGANRCIIFDASWNPTHDVQSIFRVYRFGQVKPVYVYRFLAQGTMEEKIYERQVTKQSLSCRVVDEHQIERHFTAESLQELYQFTPDRLDDPDRKENPLPALPKDRLLAELLTDQKDWIVGYHEHDSLLENQIGEELTEEERKTAWEEYEQEKQGIIKQVATGNFLPQQQRVFQQPYAGMGSMQQTPGMNSMSMFPHLTEVARAIRSANPNISMAELQQRLEHYMRLQMASQQQALYQQQQQMQRYQGMQYGGAEPGEVTFLGYGQQGGRPPQASAAPALFNVLNGAKKE